jgi:hypothetical protein
MLNTPFLAIVAVTPLFRPWRPIPCNMLEDIQPEILFIGRLSIHRIYWGGINSRRNSSYAYSYLSGHNLLRDCPCTRDLFQMRTIGLQWLLNHFKRIASVTPVPKPASEKVCKQIRQWTQDNFFFLPHTNLKKCQNNRNENIPVVSVQTNQTGRTFCTAQM